MAVKISAVVIGWRKLTQTIQVPAGSTNLSDLAQEYFIRSVPFQYVGRVTDVVAVPVAA